MNKSCRLLLLFLFFFFACALDKPVHSNVISFQRTTRGTSKIICLKEKRQLSGEEGSRVHLIKRDARVWWHYSFAPWFTANHYDDYMRYRWIDIFHDSNPSPARQLMAMNGRDEKSFIQTKEWEWSTLVKRLPLYLHQMKHRILNSGHRHLP